MYQKATYSKLSIINIFLRTSIHNKITNIEKKKRHSSPNSRGAFPFSLHNCVCTYEIMKMIFLHHTCVSHLLRKFKGLKNYIVQKRRFILLIHSWVLHKQASYFLFIKSATCCLLRGQYMWKHWCGFFHP